MNGGVDSSVCAILLKDMGYDVVRMTFLFDSQNEVYKGSWIEAKKLTDNLRIKHHIVDLINTFKKTVIKYFKKEYEVGRTPFPCAYCNPKIKFKYLQEYAERENCDFIATDHYVKTKNFNNKNTFTKILFLKKISHYFFGV
jgi:tRNA-specific 2-thiouridylase